MHIQLENKDQYSIEAYDSHAVRINGKLYEQSLVLSEKALIANWPLKSLAELNEERLEPLVQLKPKVILIGSHDAAKVVAPQLILSLAERQIGIELMSVAAACRTFNVLLSEGREVVLGLVFKSI